MIGISAAVGGIRIGSRRGCLWLVQCETVFWLEETRDWSLLSKCLKLINGGWFCSNLLFFYLETVDLDTFFCANTLLD